MNLPIESPRRKLAYSALNASRVLVLTAPLLQSMAAAQTLPKVFYACYVPPTGVVYRIKEPGLPKQCLAASHVQFNWTDGDGAVRSGDPAAGDLAGTYPNPSVVALHGRPVAATAPTTAGQVLSWNGSAWEPAGMPGGGVTDHGALTGLLDDDHPQYLLTDGTRATTNGFAVTGSSGVGTIPVSGPGVRLMWYPGKAAFRVGETDGQWDDQFIGYASVAMGFETTANGDASTALGRRSHASGGSSIAIGEGASASGAAAVALGWSTTASGSHATAIGDDAFAGGQGATALGEDAVADGAEARAFGYNSHASGAYSMALGRGANTFFHSGAFVYGDASTSVTSNGDILAQADNEFAVRASGGFRFRTSPDLSTGCDLPAGSGVFSCTSSRLTKEQFLPLDAEAVLGKITGLPIQAWNYRTEPRVRHVGPTAEDFHAAFGLGRDSTSIGLIDEAGITLVAIQALVERTDHLRRENEALRAKLARLESLMRERQP